MNGVVGTIGEAGRRDLFYLDDGMHMKQRTWNGSEWVIHWIELGGVFTSVPAAVSRMDRRRPRPPIDIGELGDFVEVDPGHEPGGPIFPGGVFTPLESGGVLAPLESLLPAAPMSPTSPAGVIGELEQRIDVFGLGTDHGMFQKTLWGEAADQPGPWRSLGGVFRSAPAAIWCADRLHVFGLGTDLAMYHRVWDRTGWSDGWARIGGYFTSPPVVVSWRPERFDLFARHADYSLRRRAFEDGEWAGDWQNLGGSLASAPTAVTWGPDRLDVFAVGNIHGITPDGGLIHRWWDGDIWNDWEQIAGTSTGDDMAFTSAPTAASWGPGRIDVFAVDTHDTVQHLWFEGSAWSNPEPMPAVHPLRETPFVQATAPGTVELIALGRDRNMWRRTLSNGVWDPVNWYQLGDRVRLPSQYRFAIDLIRCRTPRSLNNDTVTGQAALKIGNWPSTVAAAGWPLAPRTQRQGDLGITAVDEGQTNLLEFGPVTIEPHETAAFTYTFVNSDGEGDAITAALDAASGKIADATLEAVIDRGTAGLAALDAVTIGSVASPVTGAIIGILTPWLSDQLHAILEDDCDGGVALENFVRRGDDLEALVAGGPAIMHVTHDGVSSPWRCGARSKYVVSWSVRRAAS